MSPEATDAKYRLQRLFAPSSIAVVGASAVEGKVGYQAMSALAAYPGEVFPINPKSPEVLGRKAFRSLGELGRPVDLVMFAVPAAACVEAAREAVSCGCGGGLILSSGFAEAGPAGAQLQAQLQELCAAGRFRILGPNTAGFINRSASLTASFVANAVAVPKGDVAIVAQSAGVNFTVSFLLERIGFGVSIAVGLGNAVDVGAADVLEFLAEHEETKAIALHLEGVPRGRQLYDVIRRVAERKPIVALTVGKDQVGEFARSHTGNLIGSYEVRRSALRQAGAVVVETTDDLAAAAAVLSVHRLRPKARPGVGLLTAQAGPALLALDALKSKGVYVPELAASTVRRIAALLPPMTHMRNPVDTGRPGPNFGDVLLALSDDEAIDVVAAYALAEPSALVPEEVLPALARRIDKPILFATQGPAGALEDTTQALRKCGMYVASSPEQLARAATALVEDAVHRERLARPTQGRPSLGVELPKFNDEFAVKKLLATLGIAVPRGVAATSREEAHAAFARRSRPLVAKILSEEVTHKTEVDGVHLHIASEAALDAALDRLDAIALNGPRRYLLEEMAAPGLEVIVGGLREPSFGPTVTVGLGGTFAEALKDTATRLAPLSAVEAKAMLEELRAAELFEGWRGSPKLDTDAVARTIVLLGDLLCQHPSIAELEINPLRVYPEGVIALDATLVRA